VICVPPFHYALRQAREEQGVLQAVSG